MLLRSARALSTAARRNYAFAFDIDGVLLKGHCAIPQARRALQLLNGDNGVKRRVPFILLTNGGGVSETAKAKQVSEILDIDISPQQIVLAHSPMRLLASKYREKRVLVVGGKGRSCYDVAKSYGFTHLVTPEDLHYWNGSIWPFSTPVALTEASACDFGHTSIQAVMMFHDSRDWGRDLQVVLDVLTSKQGIVGTQRTHRVQEMPLYFSNNDLIWSTEFPVPRIGQGAFKVALEGLYKTLTGQELQSTSYGKPHKATYRFAERLMDTLSPSALTTPRHVYAIGDNPAADIKGANCMKNWTSILVRTGVFTGPGNDADHPANHVCDNVLDAVRWVIDREEQRKE